jgi:hypothetical protein
LQSGSATAYPDHGKNEDPARNGSRRQQKALAVGARKSYNFIPSLFQNQPRTRTTKGRGRSAGSQAGGAAVPAAPVETACSLKIRNR